MKHTTENTNTDRVSFAGYEYEVIYDDTGIVPWEEYDCYGIVTDHRNNTSDIILGGGYFCPIAKNKKLLRDEFNVEPEDVEECFNNAVDRLRGFIAGDWHYVTVIVYAMAVDESGDLFCIAHALSLIHI